MEFTEKTLEDMIISGLKSDGFGDENYFEELKKRGLPVFRDRKPMIVKRQLRIPDHGVADIVTLDKPPGGRPMITIYELKKGVVGGDAIAQVFRYLNGIKIWLSEVKDERNYDFRVVIVGYSSDRSEWMGLLDNFKVAVEFCIYRLDLTGLRFITIPNGKI